MASSNKTCGFSLTLLFTFFVSSASIVGILVTPALPNIKQSFHLSVLQTQMITTVFLLAYLLGQMLYGPLAKRFGRVNAVTIGMTLNFLGQLICVTASFLHNYVFFNIDSPNS